MCMCVCVCVRTCVRARTQPHTQWPTFSLCLEGLQGWLHVATIMSALQLLCCLGQGDCVCGYVGAHMSSCMTVCVLRQVHRNRALPPDTVTCDPSLLLTRGSGLILLHNTQYKWLINSSSVSLQLTHTDACLSNGLCNEL